MVLYISYYLFIPRHFVLLVAITNGDFFPFYFLPKYRTEINFCIILNLFFFKKLILKIEIKYSSVIFLCSLIYEKKNQTYKQTHTLFPLERSELGLTSQLDFQFHHCPLMPSHFASAQMPHSLFPNMKCWSG